MQPSRSLNGTTRPCRGATFRAASSEKSSRRLEWSSEGVAHDKPPSPGKAGVRSLGGIIEHRVQCHPFASCPLRPRLHRRLLGHWPNSAYSEQARIASTELAGRCPSALRLTRKGDGARPWGRPLAKGGMSGCPAPSFASPAGRTLRGERSAVPELGHPLSAALVSSSVNPQTCVKSAGGRVRRSAGSGGAWVDGVSAGCLGDDSRGCATVVRAGAFRAVGIASPLCGSIVCPPSKTW